MDSPILTKVSDRKVLLSLVIPVYNEELVIDITINRVRQVLESMKIKYEIIVINDGSTDGTMEILLKAKKNDSLRVLSIINNSGK
jgi:dolichol-phosphate mannosyltransferase